MAEPVSTPAGGMRRIGRNVVRTLLALVDAAAMLAVAAWCLGRLVSDAFGWSQWLLWIPTAATLIAAVVGLLAATGPGRRPGIRRRRVLVWLAVLACLTIHLLFVDHHALRARCPDTDEGLDLVHWNMTAKRVVPVAARAAVVVEQDADLTIVTNPSLLLSDRDLRVWACDMTVQFRRPFGVISRLPVKTFRILIASDDIHVALLEIDAGLPEHPSLVLWLVDLPSDPRLARASIVDRATQLLDSVDAPPPDLVVGDLNMTRGSRMLKRLAPDLRNAFDVAGVGIGATYPRRLPIYHIDHVLVRPEVPVGCSRLLDPGVGEHRLQRVRLGGEVPSDRATRRAKPPGR